MPAAATIAVILRYLNEQIAIRVGEKPPPLDEASDDGGPGVGANEDSEDAEDTGGAVPGTPESVTGLCVPRAAR